MAGFNRRASRVAWIARGVSSGASVTSVGITPTEP